MAKIGDNTMREMEEILNESETYADRLAEFLKLKTSQKPQSYKPFALDALDFSLDIDLDLIKVPAKPNSDQPLRETNTSNVPNAKSPPRPEAPPSLQNGENLRPATSPRRSLKRSGGICVPGSDRLRRVALQRRSRSCGRRDLLREFNSASASSSDFLPTFSSTPASIIVPENRTPINSQPQQQNIQLPIASGVTEATAAAPTSTLRQQFEASMMQQRQKHCELPSTSISQRSLGSVSRLSTTPDRGAIQRTYTVELGPEPGQLLLSPSQKSNNSKLQQRLSQISSSMSVCDASVGQRLTRLRHKSQIVEPSPFRDLRSPKTPNRPMPEPETQLQQQQQILNNLSSNAAVAPFIVVPMACLSPKSLNQVKPPTAAQTPIAPTTAPPAAPVVPSEPTVANRSMQTSCSPRYVQNLIEIMTDDESDHEDTSSAPLNLAPVGGNTTIQRRLWRRSQRQKSPIQLLDLHRSRSKDTRNVSNRMPRRTVLNKPSRPSINGERFAKELARTKNYEILDLRKRNSGKMDPLNAHRQHPAEQNMVLEQHIEWKTLQKRSNDMPANISIATTASTSETEPESENHVGNSTIHYQDISGQQQRPYRLRPRPAAQTSKKLPMSSSTLMQSPAAPPEDFKDSSIHHQVTSTHRQSSRLRHWGQPTETFENESMPTSTLSPCSVKPPDNFRDSPKGQQLISKQHERRSLRRNIETPISNSQNELMFTSTPIEAAYVIRNNTVHQRSTRQQDTSKEQQQRIRSRNREPSMNMVDEQFAVCTPPTQFRSSKYRLEEQLEVPTAVVEPPLEFIDAVQSNAEQELQQETTELPPHTEFVIDAEQISSHMEELRLELSASMQPPCMEQTQIDEQPSTSTAVRQLLESNSSKQQSKKDKSQGQQLKNKDTIQEESQAEPSSDVFKKPMAPAPRAKGSRKPKKQSELDNLRITLVNEMLPPDDNTMNGVRKSKRGQVPLSNNWSVTLKDPFAFMRKKEENFWKPEPRKGKKHATQDSTSLMIDRPPLSSSTPRYEASPSTGERLQDQQNATSHTDMSGIARLGSITEQEENPLSQKRSVPKTRRRKKKTRTVDDATPKLKTDGKKKMCNQQTEPELESELEPMPPNDETEQVPESDPSPQNLNQPQAQSFPLINWLRGIEELPVSNDSITTETENDSVVISRANNIQFTKLDGIDYAFYHTGDSYSVGYMRFEPLQERGLKRAKHNKLQFVALYGRFDLIINSPDSMDSTSEHYNMNTGDMVEIKKGNSYNIINLVNEVSVLLVNRK